MKKGKNRITKKSKDKKKKLTADIKTLLWSKSHLTALLKPWVILLVVGGLLFGKGREYGKLVVAVLDWSAVVSVSPQAKEGDRIVEELWRKEEARILQLAETLQKQLDAKPPQEKAAFEEQARKQIADEIQKSSQLVQQEVMKHVSMTVETIRGIVERYCKTHKIDLVINKQAGVIYATPVIDITEDIIQEVQKLGRGGR